MIKARSIKPNARSRRDESRKAKQQAWAAANPLLVGRSYQNVGETVEVVNKPGYEPQCIKFVAQDAFWSAREYRGQIIRATYLYEYEFGRKATTEGSICLPDVAKYYAGHRKVNIHISAR